jgi:ParB-like chromosome segregation protein Spo0J
LKTKEMQMKEMEAQRKDFWMVPVSEIVEEENYADTDRGTKEEFDDLVRSILTRGVRRPLVCYRSREGKFVLMAGHRRLKAVRFINDGKLYAGKQESGPLAGVESAGEPVLRVPVMLEDRNANDTVRLVDSMIDNMFACKVGPMEESNGYDKLMQVSGLGVNEIASLAGVRVDRVKNYLSLLKAATPVQKALAKGDVGVSAVVNLVRKSKDEKEQVQKLEEAKAASGRKQRATSKATAKVTRTKPQKRSTRGIPEAEKALEVVTKMLGEAERNMPAKLQEAVVAKTRQEMIEWFLFRREAPWEEKKSGE